jgi:hypothetical protein
VLDLFGQSIRFHLFHPTLIEPSAYYHYEPRRVAVAPGNEKGRIERAIC